MWWLLLSNLDRKIMNSKQDKEKDCKEEVQTILDKVMGIIKTHEETVNVSK